MLEHILFYAVWFCLNSDLNSIFYLEKLWKIKKTRELTYLCLDQSRSAHRPWPSFWPGRCARPSLLSALSQWNLDPLGSDSPCLLPQARSSQFLPRETTPSNREFHEIFVTPCSYKAHKPLCTMQELPWNRPRRRAPPPSWSLLAWANPLDESRVSSSILWWFSFTFRRSEMPYRWASV